MFIKYLYNSFIIYLFPFIFFLCFVLFMFVYRAVLHSTIKRTCIDWQALRLRQQQVCTVIDV